MANVRAGLFDAIKLGGAWSAQRTDLVTPVWCCQRMVAESGSRRCLSPEERILTEESQRRGPGSQSRFRPWAR